MNLPFSVYDFFGYLASGFLICVGADYLAGDHWILRHDMPLHHAALWIAVSYVVGHLNAGVASFLLERRVVGKVLGRPNRNLFGHKPKKWFTCLFPDYYTPLDAGVQQRVMDRARALGIMEPGEALFHHIRSHVKRETATMSRVDAFLHLYGFCRNISCALLVTAAALATYAILAARPPQHVWWCALAAAAGGVGMFYRYLKFYRLYSYEMFNTYPDLPAATG